ncbi:6-pyruvoyl-tetrahydropterin synthase-related protein [Tunturiibacter psychrotolerans]|uniref:6-pyruvoyl-tetrahydropterin synthase-related protein n=1 Tax=Tunturiibacter psychrotolerans TaxID=3069686 RepID=UPI003D1DB7C2
MQRDRLPYLLIPLAACIAILPLILHGCSCGHDFDFHLLNWMEAARQFTHGNLHPHWAYTAAWNAGEPRFVFYPPLSWTLGAILTLIFPITATPIVYTWLALTASGLALHRLARAFAPPTAALIAAILYTVNPYMLFTAYERTAYAELLAAAFIPLLLHAILRERVTIPSIAIPIALLWLTNAPAAVMSCYALALLTLIRLAKPSSLRREIAINTIAGTILGLALAAFYIVPAAYERRYVQIAMAIIPNMRIQDNFLFHHTGDLAHDQVLHTASLLAIILLTLTIVAIAIAFTQSGKKNTPTNPADHFTNFADDNPLSLSNPLKKSASRPDPEQAKRVEGEVERPPHFTGITITPPAPRNLNISLAILTAAIALLLTPLTAIIWNHAPELAFLQFPWRFLAILAAVFGLCAALALTRVHLRPLTRTLIAIVIAATLTYPAYTFFHQSCDEEDTPTARQALFQSNQGTDPTDEYTPTTADNDSLSPKDPAFWLSPDPNAKAPTNTQPGPTPPHITINAPTAEDLILNLRDYPSWHITLNGSPDSTRDQRDDGLIALPIPVGPSTIEITYTHTLDQTIGDTISLLALATLFFLIRRTSQSQTTLS